MPGLIVSHNYGFFSCCSIKLNNIIKFFNENKRLPLNVYSEKMFDWYKVNTSRDITYDYFEHYNNKENIQYNRNADFHETYQYRNYSELDYSNIIPFIKKYFSPSIEIQNIITYIEKKYQLDYQNICVLFYRGNDKNTETTICSYEEYIKKAKIILKTNPKIHFLIQSDETEFIEIILKEFPNNSFYFKDEIRHMKKCMDTVDNIIKNNIDIYSKKYLAITIIMSRCNYIVCGSGNCSIWIMLYRGNNKNVFQNNGVSWY
jgi:hypothetical protein